MKNLEEVITGISKDDTLLDSVEEAVRQGAILPVLAFLGWNTYNIRQVIPEYNIEGKRVDYCLKIGDKKAVFIEVKRASEDLERHEKQLLEYSFSDGVEIAILTNGIVWWFYLPLGGGNWSQRKFFAIDVKQQTPRQASKNFRTFLSHDSVSSGKALSQAKSVHESKTRKRIIQQTIPKAWEELIGGPDELLLELFVEKVEGMCGYRPEAQDLVEYLRASFTKKAKKIKKIAKPPQKIKTSAAPQINKDRRKKGVKINIDGQLFEAISVRDLYSQILDFLISREEQINLRQHIPFATSGKRYLLSDSPYHPKGNAFVVPVESNGLYLEAHKSYENAISALNKLLNELGLSLNVED